MSTYLTEKPNHPDEAGYVIEDGVLVEPEPRVRLRDLWALADASPSFAKAMEEVEEARWAARSGPSVVLRPAS